MGQQLGGQRLFSAAGDVDDSDVEAREDAGDQQAGHKRVLLSGVAGCGPALQLPGGCCWYTLPHPRKG